VGFFYLVKQDNKKPNNKITPKVNPAATLTKRIILSISCGMKIHFTLTVFGNAAYPGNSLPQNIQPRQG